MLCVGVQMVGSEFTDVKLKAIQMLADLTAEAVYSDALAAECGAAGAGAGAGAGATTKSQPTQSQSQSTQSTATPFNAVLSCVSHANEDVQRCALTTIANLTATAHKREHVCSRVVASAQAWAAVGQALGGGRSGSAQITREAARAIANIVDTGMCAAVRCCALLCLPLYLLAHHHFLCCCVVSSGGSQWKRTGIECCESGRRFTVEFHRFRRAASR